MRRFSFLAAGLLAVLLPELAFAHSPIKGMDSFYNGVLHPVLVPAHLLAIVTSGLLIGQHGAKAMQPAVILFMVTLVAVLLATGQFDLAFPEKTAMILLLTLSIASGLLVAFEKTIPLPVLLAVAAAAALLVGLDSSQPELEGRRKLAILAGTGVGASLLMLYAAAAAEFANKAWQKIGIRIVGSWGTAASFIVLAFTFSEV
jgi:urease accessory protein